MAHATTPATQMEFQVANWPVGLYSYLAILADGRIKVGKIIVQH
jgi:hypothetical protein